ncbi:hypothetical protein CF5_0169 [Staphylococcus phage CF5]|uniref:Uncharacterized protein n=1 Tax=Staphylococcus phage CF5 TaxID=3113739 RepID=A0AAX4J796_9CAUD|nr:hypothetical protein CF5_0169 [Staphylococcus phage CF5]
MYMDFITECISRGDYVHVVITDKEVKFISDNATNVYPISMIDIEGLKEYIRFMNNFGSKITIGVE